MNRTEYKKVSLSERLSALVQMVTHGNRVCDVGCDHGFVSIYLIQSNISPKVIAMDVKEGPLTRAKEHIEKYEMSKYIETRLSDGLSALKQGEADTMICAGMGGKLMERILTEGREKAWMLKEIILQPQSEISAFRKFLRLEGYQVIAENMIEEEGKYYPMMKVVPGVTPQISSDSYYDQYGEFLLKEQNPVLKAFLLEKQESILKVLKVLPESDRERIENRKSELTEELKDVRGALFYFD